MPVINGSPLDDKLVDAQGDDAIDAGSGNDSLWGLAGLDTLRGGTGNDRILTGNGASLVYAGDGDDEVNGFVVNRLTGSYSWFAAQGPVTVFGGAGGDFLVGSEGSD